MVTGGRVIVVSGKVVVASGTGGAGGTDVVPVCDHCLYFKTAF